MSYTVITTKIDHQTKRNAQKVAAELGLTLSAVVKTLLQQFIRTKRLEGKVRKEEPSEYLKQFLKESQEDVKAGRVISFKNGKEALEYIDSLIKDDVTIT